MATKITVVTHLQMKAPPQRAPVPMRVGCQVVRAIRPPVHFYRYLYDTVGEKWLWYERRRMPAADLEAVIWDPSVEIWVLWVDGVPAGYAELDGRKPDLELAYFGLTPEFVGHGLGRWFLDWTVDKAWSKNPPRFWVHTCDLDHPRALATYQNAGFVIFDRTEEAYPDDL